MYQKNLNDLKDIKFFQPCVNANFIPFRVAVLSNKKEVLDQAFKDEFIETRSFFYPLRKQPCFADFKIDCDKNFNSDFAYKNGICLPSFVGIEDWQILKICETIKKTL
jgi:perosamine synthetase